VRCPRWSESACRIAASISAISSSGEFFCATRYRRADLSALSGRLQPVNQSVLGKFNKEKYHASFHRRGDNTNHLHCCSGRCRTGPQSRPNRDPVRSTFGAEAKWTGRVSSPGLHTGLRGGEAFRAAIDDL
jgi:hypothetical protein